jgi:hypothetical protein
VSESSWRWASADCRLLECERVECHVRSAHEAFPRNNKEVVLRYTHMHARAWAQVIVQEESPRRSSPAGWITNLRGLASIYKRPVSASRESFPAVTGDLVWGGARPAQLHHNRHPPVDMRDSQRGSPAPSMPSPGLPSAPCHQHPLGELRDLRLLAALLFG